MDAEAELTENDFDLLVTNVLLPGGSGLNLVKRAKLRRIPSIVISGHPEQLAHVDPDEHGWLRKPFRLADLTTMINRKLRASAMASDSAANT
jgi:DNA-binding response OmpR family regulator